MSRAGGGQMVHSMRTVFDSYHQPLPRVSYLRVQEAVYRAGCCVRVRQRGYEPCDHGAMWHKGACGCLLPLTPPWIRLGARFRSRGCVLTLNWEQMSSPRPDCPGLSRQLWPGIKTIKAIQTTRRCKIAPRNKATFYSSHAGRDTRAE